MNTEMVKNLVRRSHSHLAIFVFGGHTHTHRRTRAGRPARLLPPLLAAHAHAQEERLPVRDGLRPPSLQPVRPTQWIWLLRECKVLEGF